MDSLYLDKLHEWERNVADPVLYEHIGELLPQYGFRRMAPGTSKDHWASPLKMDLTRPRHRTAEKTVLYPGDMHLREQGEWSMGVWVLTRLASDMGLDSPYEVYRRISERYGLDMPRPDSADVMESVKAGQKKVEILQALQEYFVWNLHNNTFSSQAPAARSYLRNRRGLSPEAIRTLGFGFVPSWDRVEKHMTQTLKFRKEDLDQACGVRNAEGRTSVGAAHIISIPYICGGVLKGFIFRRIDSDKAPKYIATAGLDRKSVFFNMPETAEDILVVEGEFDALVSTAFGIPSVVAMGGSDISGERRRMVSDAFSRGVRRILLCPDLDTVTDEAGNEVPNHAKRHRAVMRSVHTIKDLDFDFDSIYVVSFPEPADPDSYIRKHGRDAFIELLRSALPYWKYDAAYRNSNN